MFFADKLTLDAPRRTKDGYMGLHARAARTGVYQYLGHEIDPAGDHFASDQVVNVYRPADEVFNKASMASFVGKPITDDHPSEAVDAANWRDLSRGTVMAAARDGEFVGFDLAFMDAGLIAQIDSGKRELSNGYSAQLDIEDGNAPDGTAYQAVQRAIKGNHVAVVAQGRAGAQCCIGDMAICLPIPSDEVAKLLVDQRTYDEARKSDRNALDDKAKPTGDQPVPKLILIDGHQIDIANVDVAEATIKTLQDKATSANDSAAKAEADLAVAATDKATLTAENETLKTQMADSKPTPAELRAAAKSYAEIADKAKALGVTVADDADEITIKRAVVDGKLGDAAKGWTDAQIDASFAALAATAKVDDAKPDRVADAIGGGVRTITDGSAAIGTARRNFLARKETAYLGDQA